MSKYANMYDIDDIRAMFYDAGYDLITNEYINRNQKLQYICRKHKDKGIQEMSLVEFLNGVKCVYCRYEMGLPYGKPWPDDIIADELDKLNCDFVDRIFKNNNSVIRFICRKHPWKGVQETTWTAIRKGKQICGICNGKNRNTEDFKKQLHDVNPNIEVLGEYTGSKNHIKVRCKIDGNIWEATPSNLLLGVGCPVCGRQKTLESRKISKEEKRKILEEIHPDIEFLEIPELASGYVTCRCKICGNIWEATYSNMVYGNDLTGCPNCKKSRSEKLIKELLGSWGYNVVTQYKFDDCKDINPLPFDFYLPDYNVLIEFDGEQHYYPINRHPNREDGEINAKIDFETVVSHDNIKTQYCYDNNIPLIRIPYWHREDLEYFLFDELFKYQVIEI